MFKLSILIIYRPFPEETLLPSEVIENDNIYSNLREEVENYRKLGQYTKIIEEDERTGQEIYDTICTQKVPTSKTLPEV